MERLKFDDAYQQMIYDTMKDDPNSLYEDMPDNILAYNNKMRTIHLVLAIEANQYLREAIKQYNEKSKLVKENLALLKDGATT